MMATGVPVGNNIIKKKVPVRVTYEGKEATDDILKTEFQIPERIVEINEDGEGNNRFFFDDNLNTLIYLLNTGYKNKIELVYIDPPFATESNFVNRKQEHAYSDALCGGEYVEFLRKRLIVLRELLSSKGSIYLHLDGKMAFTMKIIMDEIFGENNCRAIITRKKCSTKNYTKKTYGNVSDYIMFYSKTDDYVWNRPYDPWELDKIIEQYPYVDKLGRRYKKVPIHAPGVRNGETGKEWRGRMPPKGKHWQYTPSKLDEMDAAGEICWSQNGNPRRMVYCDPTKGIPVQDIWLNYRDSINQQNKTTGYPTEKNYDMLKMIVGASSSPEGIVLDCFAGSGTTLGAAYELGRNWIGVDNSPESMKAVLKRFVSGLETYGDYVNSSECIQESFDTEKKCRFQVVSTEDNYQRLKEICYGM